MGILDLSAVPVDSDERYMRLALQQARKGLGKTSPNPGGHRISTARVESTVDQLVDWRMEKKQHMRWTRHGAQMLLNAGMSDDRNTSDPGAA
jgi:hypothetical protein